MTRHTRKGTGAVAGATGDQARVCEPDSDGVCTHYVGELANIILPDIIEELTGQQFIPCKVVAVGPDSDGAWPIVSIRITGGNDTQYRRGQLRGRAQDLVMPRSHKPQHRRGPIVTNWRWARRLGAPIAGEGWLGSLLA